MVKRIIYSNPDGSVAIIIPAKGMPLDAVEALDVPRLVIVSAEGSSGTINKGSIINVKDFYKLMGASDMSEGEANALIGKHLRHLPNRRIDVTDLPKDRVFRDAWDDSNAGESVGIDLNKAANIVHGKRRDKRDQEFEPLDKVIAKQIPGEDANKAEEGRQKIRDKDNLIQANIDASSTEEELRAIISNFDL